MTPVGSAGAAGSSDRAGASTDAPAPMGPPLLPAGDLTSMMFATQVARRSAERQAAADQAQGAHKDRDRAIVEAREAVGRAEAESRAAAESSFLGIKFGKIADLAATVASIAKYTPIGLSSSAALAIGGVLISSNADWFRAKLGDGAGAAAQWGGLGLGVAFGYVAAQESVGLGGCSPGTVEVSAKATMVGARFGQTHHNVRSAHHAEESSHERANSMEARSRVDAAQGDVDEIIAMLDTVEKATRRGIQAVMGIAAETDANRSALVARMGRM